MALTELQLKPFADFIKRELGIIYDVQNYYQLEQRLGKIAQMMSLGSSEEICTLQAKSGITGTLKQLLVDIATNNETMFFRDPKVFKSVADYIFENLRKDHPKADVFKMWSAASSSGQEPYSLAILADELLAKYPIHPRFEILATDISETILRRASEGIYSQLEVQRGLSAPRMIKYFDKREDGMWVVKPSVRKMIKFERFNLLDPVPAFREVHVLFCRYVLIYQDHAKKVEIVNRLVKTLQPGGYFVFGASESGLGISDALEQVIVDGNVFYRKKH